MIAKFPAPDRVAGSAALLRQLYAPDERASFRAASGILMKHANQAQDEQADHRRDEPLRWGKAAGKLRMSSIERLAIEKLIDEGQFPPIEEVRAGTYPDRENPQQVISTFFYGQRLHWTRDKAAIPSGRKLDAFEDARFNLFFLQAAGGLAHVYIACSVLARSAAGQCSRLTTAGTPPSIWPLTRGSVSPPLLQAFSGHSGARR